MMGKRFWKRKRVRSTGNVVVAGAGSGLAVGSATGTPLTGMALGALRAVVRDFLSRQLSQVQRDRIDVVCEMAVKRVESHVTMGRRARDDGFFDEKPDGGSDAEEVLENILLRVQDEPERKKLPYMANFLANIGFDNFAFLSTSNAHSMLQTANQLTYRQLCILRLAETTSEYSLKDKTYRETPGSLNDDGDELGPINVDLVGVLQAIHDLKKREYIGFSENRGGPTFMDVHPAAMVTLPFGHFLHAVMNLKDIPHKDIEAIADLLGERREA